MPTDTTLPFEPDGAEAVRTGWGEDDPSSTSHWIERVAARMLALDPALPESEVFDIVRSLSKFPEWRAMPPEDAALKAFEPPDSGTSP